MRMRVCCWDAQGGKFVLERLVNVTSQLQLVDAESGEVIRDLPSGIGSIDSITGNTQHSEVTWVYNSFTEPSTIYWCRPPFELHNEVSLLRSPFQAKSSQISRHLISSCKHDKKLIFQALL